MVSLQQRQVDPLSVVQLKPKESASQDRPKKRKRPKARFRRKLGLIVMVVMVGNIAYSYINLHLKEASIQRDIVEVQTQLQEEHRELERLRREIEWLETKEYVEQAARQQLGMVKQGETVLYFEETGKTSQ